MVIHAAPKRSSDASMLGSSFLPCNTYLLSSNLKGGDRIIFLNCHLKISINLCFGLSLLYLLAYISLRYKYGNFAP